jgi:prepilin-type processing-associated H-X9-DG protein
VSLNVSRVANETRLVLMGDYGFDDWQNPAQNDAALEFHARAWRRSGEVAYDPLAASRHNVAFVDGHAGFVPIRKGIHVCADYTMIPFRDMQQAFTEDQKPGNYPP